ncbi:hypothetical protein [Streptomyces sp. AC154]|uniref:hypothetical protein n=1 Tax=Streptomyces sp. AC154 TaxID=3143184 RepID=UPI003F81CE45
MAEKWSGDEHGFALADALGELDTGPEPPMPDLVPGAVARGARIRRRRRIGAALGTAVMAAVVAVGGYGLLAPATQENRQPLPAAEPSAWYPSPELLRSILPTSAGTIEAARPARPGYFRMTDRTGLVTSLYVTVARSAAPLAPPADVWRCQDGRGRLLTSPWGGRLTKCSALRTRTGDSVLEYFMEMEQLPARMRAPGVGYAWGLSYLTSGGWTVQLISSPRSEGRRGLEGTVPNKRVLTQLVTDYRLFDAVEPAGGG